MESKRINLGGHKAEAICNFSLWGHHFETIRIGDCQWLSVSNSLAAQKNPLDLWFRRRNINTKKYVKDIELSDEDQRSYRSNTKDKQQTDRYKSIIKSWTTTERTWFQTCKKTTVNSSSQVNNYCVELEREKKENVDYCQRLTQMRFNVVTVLSTPKDNTIRVLAYQTRISLSAPWHDHKYLVRSSVQVKLLLTTE